MEIPERDDLLRFFLPYKELNSVGRDALFCIGSIWLYVY
jgi:hypothetical protein